MWEWRKTGKAVRVRREDERQKAGGKMFRLNELRVIMTFFAASTKVEGERER